MRLGTGTTTTSKRISLRGNASHFTAGQYHKQTYSHYMRITNLLLDITWIIGSELRSFTDPNSGTMMIMRIISVTDVKAKINEYVDAVRETRDQITITKNGAPAAVLLGVDEWESIQETLHWLSQPDLMESVKQSEADIAAGRTYGEDEIRAEYQVPRRPH
jgi:antitoxin YefM